MNKRAEVENGNTQSRRLCSGVVYRLQVLVALYPDLVAVDVSSNGLRRWQSSPWRLRAPRISIRFRLGILDDHDQSVSWILSCLHDGGRGWKMVVSWRVAGWRLCNLLGSRRFMSVDFIQSVQLCMMPQRRSVPRCDRSLQEHDITCWLGNKVP